MTHEVELRIAGDAVEPDPVTREAPPQDLAEPLALRPVDSALHQPPSLRTRQPYGEGTASLARSGRSRGNSVNPPQETCLFLAIKYKQILCQKECNFEVRYTESSMGYSLGTNERLFHVRRSVPVPPLCLSLHPKPAPPPATRLQHPDSGASTHPSSPAPAPLLSPPAALR